MSRPRSKSVPTRGRLRAAGAMLRRPVGLSLGLHALGLWAFVALVVPPAGAERPGPMPVLVVSSLAMHADPVPAIVVPDLRRVEAAAAFELDAEPLPVPVDDTLPEVAAWRSERLPSEAPLRVTPKMLRSLAVPAPAAVPLPVSLPAPSVRVTPPAPRTRPAVSGLRRVYTPRVIDYYPLALRRRGIEGRVMIKVTLDGGGRVLLASVLQGSGHVALDQAGLRLIRATRFVATGRRVIGKMPINFRLQ